MEWKILNQMEFCQCLIMVASTSSLFSTRTVTALGISLIRNLEAKTWEGIAILVYSDLNVSL